MRILHVLYSNSFSGAENVAIQIIENFKKSDNVYYCSPEGNISSVLDRKGIQYLPVSTLCVKEMKRVINKVQPDIIHAHDFRASFISILSTKTIPVVSHLHNNCPWLRKKCLKSYIFLYIAKKSKVILTVSRSVMNEYIFGERFSSKTMIVGNPVDVNKIREQRSKIQGKESDIVFCGRLTEQKNPFLFLDIIKKLTCVFPGITAVMLGDGTLFDSVQKRLHELDLCENIKMLGFVENPIPLMAKSKVLVVTSSWEGFGLVAVEALSLGKPVVASNVGGLPDLINEKCGLICETLSDYVDEITKLLQIEQYYESKSIGANNRAEELSNIDRYIGTIKEAYFKASDR